MSTPLLDAFLRAGPRGYVIAWASGGLVATALLLAAGDDDPAVAQAPAAAPPTLLHRLLLAPWLAPARLLQRAARSFPQPLSSPLFLAPAGLLAASVLLAPLGAGGRLGALRRAAATMAGLHCLSLSHCEASHASALAASSRGTASGGGGGGGGKGGGAGLWLALAAGLGGLALLCAGTAPPAAALLPATAPGASSVHAAAAEAVESSPYAAWAAQLVGSSSQALKDHAIMGLNEAEKYAKTAEVGLGLAGVPFPLAAAVEGTKTMLGVKSQAPPAAASLTEAQLAALAHAVTWGELEARAPGAAGVLGGALAALVVGALALQRSAAQ